MLKENQGTRSSPEVGWFHCLPGDFEQRHPQDFVKAKTDKITVPFTRPIPEYVYVDTPIGMFDPVRYIENVSVSWGTSRSFTDSYSVTESIELVAGFFLYDTTTNTDSFSRVFNSVRNFTDTYTTAEVGYLYLYDYTTPDQSDPNTYFASDYVGLVASFT